MAHFAELDESNIVKQVIVIHNNELLDESGNELEQKGIDFCVAHYGGTWIQTSYNGNFRKNYAGVGFIYDPIRDAFYLPQPFPSWTLDNNAIWQPPVPVPEGEVLYQWDEATLSWIAPTE
jgi:hypothetical protein